MCESHVVDLWEIKDQLKSHKNPPKAPYPTLTSNFSLKAYKSPI